MDYTINTYTKHVRRKTRSTSSRASAVEGTTSHEGSARARTRQTRLEVERGERWRSVNTQRGHKKHRESACFVALEADATPGPTRRARHTRARESRQIGGRGGVGGATIYPLIGIALQATPSASSASGEYMASCRRVPGLIPARYGPLRNEAGFLRLPRPQQLPRPPTTAVDTPGEGGGKACQSPRTS